MGGWTTDDGRRGLSADVVVRPTGNSGGSGSETVHAEVAAPAVPAASPCRVSRCPDERVLEVSVQRHDSGSGGIVKGPVLWRIKSSNGVAVDAVTVGESPKGFDTVVALDGPLPPDAEVVVEVKTTYAKGNMGVRLSALDLGKVYVFGDDVPRQDFEGDAKSC